MWLRNRFPTTGVPVGRFETGILKRYNNSQKKPGRPKRREKISSEQKQQTVGT